MISGKRQNESKESSRQRRGQPHGVLQHELRRGQKELHRQRHLPQDVVGLKANQVDHHRRQSLELLPGRKYEGQQCLPT